MILLTGGTGLLGSHLLYELMRQHEEVVALKRPSSNLEEVKRVVRPGGRVVLLEHVRVNAPVIGPLMDLLDPVVLRLMGPHINRRTVENVKKAGLKVEQVQELVAGGLVKLILARSQ